jgi:SAM-dependent methyltransferase
MTDYGSFPWPPLPGTASPPRWNGRGFEVGPQTRRILSYEVASSHWSDDLTSLHEAEAGRDHPIDLASRRMAVASMTKLQATAPVILDAGCSSGFLLEELRQAMPSAFLIGADYLRGPLENLARRVQDIPILQFDLRRCPLPDGCLDGITCLNVLEHIDQDETALREIWRILKPGGIAHVEVPAGPSLYDIYDEHLMHHRRYRLEDLKLLARRAGFSISNSTHLGALVFPAFWWVKRSNRRKLSLPAEEKARIVAGQIRATRASMPFAALIKLELLLGRHLRYPWGIRCVVVLRKA